MLARDLFYHEIVEAIEKPGCPICNILEKEERNTLWDILYERVNDPGVREKFRRSLGLCRHHAWRLYELSRRDPLIGEPGPAIIYHDVLETAVERGLWEKPIDGECFICKRIDESNEAFIEEFANKAASTDLLEVYENNKSSILCRYHYSMILKRLARIDKKSADRLREIQSSKINDLINALKNFIDTYDYRSSRRPTSYESLSTFLAITYLKGSTILDVINK